MNVRHLTDESAIVAIVPAWRELFARAARPQVVQSPVWALEWWREFGRDDGRQMRALAVEADDGRLVGLALFASRVVRHGGVWPVRRLEAWMTGERREHEIYCEYVGVLAEAGSEGDVAGALVSALGEGSLGRFDELSIVRGSSDDPMLPALASALDTRGYRVVLRPTATCDYVRLPNTWGAYLKSLKKSHRYNVRLSLAELDKWAGEDSVELCEAVDAPSALEGLEILRRLHGARWAKQRTGGLFASTRFARFHERVVPELVEQGLVDLLWLRVGGRPVAALYNLVVEGRHQVYQSGRVVDGVPHRLSLGTALHALAIQRAIARGGTEYDFLGGDTLYKRQFANDARELVDMVAWSPGLRGRVSGALVHAIERTQQLWRSVSTAPAVRPVVQREPEAGPHDTTEPRRQSPQASSTASVDCSDSKRPSSRPPARPSPPPAE